MASVGVGYDTGASTYSPAGRVFQVEYASKAVENTGTVIGIRCQDGVVLGVEKIVRNKMLVTSSYRRIFTTSMNSGIAVGGLLPDGRQLVNRARDESSSYKSNFGISIPGKVLSQRIALYVHAYTEYWHLRPFGVACLLCVYDEDESLGPQLYMIEPSGECLRYYGIAVGKGSQAARVQLEKLNFDTVKCREAVVRIAEIIYELHDEVKDKPFELELSWVCDESKKRHTFVPKDLYSEAIAAGVKAAEDEESDDEDDDEDQDMVDKEKQSKEAKKDE